MEINHQHVSAAAPSADPAKVGSAEWNDPHVMTGMRMLGAAHIIPNNEAPGDPMCDPALTGLVIINDGVGLYTVRSTTGILWNVVATCTGDAQVASMLQQYGDVSLSFQTPGTTTPVTPERFSVIGFGDDDQH